jgi:hypothetical protein
VHLARWRLYLVASVIVVVVVGIWLTYTFFTSRFPGGNDLLPRWVGTCTLLREGKSPYSEEVAQRTQMMVLGRLAEEPEDDRAYFAYPLYCILYFWPLCATEDFALARAIWMWVSLGGLLTATLLWMEMIDRRPRLGMWAWTMVWVVFLYHDFRALVLGQFAVFVLLALVATLWAMRRGRNGWAGCFLALSTAKPPLVYLAIPWILLWAAGKRRWRLWWGFGVSMGLLMLGSTILLPSWISGTIQQSLAYSSYTVYASLTGMLVQNVLKLGPVAEIAAMVALAAVALVLGWRFWRGTWEQMLWMLGFLLLLTNFFTPRIATTNYLVLVPWALWGFVWIRRVWGRRGVWIVVLLEIVLLIGLWIVFLATIEGNFERAPVYFPFPVAVSLLLAWLWKRVHRREADVSG